VALRQEYDMAKLDQPRLWFGQGFYNFEMRTKRELKVDPGEKFTTKFTWKLIHDVDSETDFKVKR